MFKTRIIQTYETKLEAEEKECSMQRRLGVVKSPMYINLTDGIQRSWIASNHDKEHYLKGSNCYKDIRTNQIVWLRTENATEFHIPYNNSSGFVNCRDIETGERLRVSKEEFDINPNLVGIEFGKKNVIIRETNNIMKISLDDFDADIHKELSEGMVVVYDSMLSKYVKVKCDIAKNDPHRYKHHSVGNVVVYSIDKKIFQSISTEMYNSTPERYIMATHAYVRFRQKITHKIVKFLIDDYENIEMYRNSEQYEELYIAPNKGKKMSEQAKAKKSKSMKKKRWFYNKQIGIERMFDVDDVPEEGWIKGRNPESLLNRESSKTQGKLKYIL